MKRNTDPAFVGIDAMKDAQREQLRKFEAAAGRGDWMAIHNDHYDWWMFPIKAGSSFGMAYSVGDDDVAELKGDPEYCRNYLSGVELLARSWGWDLRAARHLTDVQPGQSWQQWPVRLYKAAKSLRLFGFQAEFESLKLFAQDLMRKGEGMYYRRDLSGLFRDHGRPGELIPEEHA